MGDRDREKMTSERPVQADSAPRSRLRDILLVVACVVLAAAVLIPSFQTCCDGTAPVSVRLKAIGVALHIYANDHQDRFPPSLDTLVEERYLEPDKLTYPTENGSSPKPSFVYIPGQTVLDSGLNVVVYEPVGNYEHHERPGGNALFVDGHVEWLEPEEHEAAIERTREYLLRATSRGTPSVASEDEATDLP